MKPEPVDGQVWLAQRRGLLSRRLQDVERKLKRGHLEGVRIENGRLKITPHEPVTPPAGEQLDRAIDAVMTRIRITELLWDVGRHTGFLDTFTDLRSGRTNANPATVLASILAGATNLGLERMAQASKNVTHAQLSWASNWYLRPETYSAALTRIIDPTTHCRCHKFGDKQNIRHLTGNFLLPLEIPVRSTQNTGPTLA